MMRMLGTLVSTPGRILVLGAVVIAATIAAAHGSNADIYPTFDAARSTIAAIGALALALIVAVWMAGDFGGPIGTALIVASSDRRRIALHRLIGIVILSAGTTALFTVSAVIARPPIAPGELVGILGTALAMTAYGLLAGAFAMLTSNAVAATVLFLVVILAIEPVGTAALGDAVGRAIAPDRYIGAVLDGTASVTDLVGFAVLVVSATGAIVWRLLRVRL